MPIPLQRIFRRRQGSHARTVEVRRFCFEDALALLCSPIGWLVAVSKVWNMTVVGSGRRHERLVLKTTAERGHWIEPCSAPCWERERSCPLVDRRKSIVRVYRCGVWRGCLEDLPKCKVYGGADAGPRSYDCEEWTLLRGSHCRLDYVRYPDQGADTTMKLS